MHVLKCTFFLHANVNSLATTPCVPSLDKQMSTDLCARGNGWTLKGWCMWLFLHLKKESFNPKLSIEIVTEAKPW